jgi:DNA-binding MarR family transcriptional regulator
VTRSAEDDVLLRLARAVVGISTRAADRLGGISIVQLRALAVLRGLGVANLGGLASAMGVTVSTASRLVDRLVTSGLVDRQPSPRSRRELALTLAPAGRGLLDQYDRLRLEELRAGLHALSGDARSDVVAALGDYASAIDRPLTAAAP